MYLCIIDKVYASIPENAKDPTKKKFGCVAGCTNEKVKKDSNQEVIGFWNNCLVPCTKDENAFKPPSPSSNNPDQNNPSNAASNNPDQNNPSNADDPETAANETTSDAGNISEGPPKYENETTNEITSGKTI